MRLTLAIKKKECPVCKNCNQKALKKRQDHCKSQFQPQNGHCANFKEDK